MQHYLTLALLLPALAATAQATLTNDGGTLTVQPGAKLYVAGAVQNNATSTLTNAGTVQLTGDLTNAGTLASSGTLLFAGATSQTFTPGTARVGTLVLNINNTASAGQRTLSLPADLTVDTALVLQRGLLRTAPTATLTLTGAATLSGEGPGQYVQGNLRILRASGSGVLDFGHGLSLNRTGLGSVTATRTAGLRTNDLSGATNLGSPSQRGIDRIWTVTTELPPTAAVPVTLQWLPDDDNGLTDFSKTQAWRAPLGSTAWAAAGPPQAATVAAGSRSFSFSTAALGRLTLSPTDAPLPVVLLRFTATAQGTDALLEWATASERNSARFEVEASADGTTFRLVGSVPAQGNSTQLHAYQILDKYIARYAADPVYYRLRQVDLDGTAAYSPVRAVRVSAPASFLAQLYPNPSHPTEQPTLLVRTTEAGPLRWQLLDALGRVVLSEAATVPAGTTTWPVRPATELATGVYLLRVQQGSHQRSLKLVRE